MVYQDEVWWSRLAQPHLHSWQADEPLRLQQKERERNDPEPQAISCYGGWLQREGKMHLRFVEGQPNSTITIAYLRWLAGELAAGGKTRAVVVWDNAPWHVSKAVKGWLREHNQAALAARRKGEAAVQLVPCWLPTKSPWLNPIEVQWVHGKRAVVEPSRKLSAEELEGRVCSYYKCEPQAHLAQEGA